MTNRIVCELRGMPHTAIILLGFIAVCDSIIIPVPLFGQVCSVNVDGADLRKLADVGVRIPRDGDQRSELMSITIPK